jgi:hypothetical protein
MVITHRKSLIVLQIMDILKLNSKKTMMKLFRNVQHYAT